MNLLELLITCKSFAQRFQKIYFSRGLIAGENCHSIQVFLHLVSLQTSTADLMESCTCRRHCRCVGGHPFGTPPPRLRAPLPPDQPYPWRPHPRPHLTPDMRGSLDGECARPFRWVSVDLFSSHKWRVGWATWESAVAHELGRLCRVTWEWYFSDHVSVTGIQESAKGQFLSFFLSFFLSLSLSVSLSVSFFLQFFPFTFLSIGSAHCLQVLQFARRIF